MQMHAKKQRSFLCGLFLALLGATAQAQDAGPGTQAEITLTRDQARGLALRAVQSGDPALALQITAGLLQADPDSYVAHMLTAQAYGQMQQHKPARQSAARAYRHAETTAQKFSAAQLAARAAVENTQYTQAQLWLRRSILHNPEPSFLPKIEDDFRKVRSMDPLHVRLDFSLAPSSNVNNGSDSRYALIDGVPIIGIFDGLSQALSGVTAGADLALRYRLARAANSETSAVSRLYGSRVWLDADAMELANSFPGADVSNDDFTFFAAEAGLRHSFRLADTPRPQIISAEITAGRSWYGGDPYQNIGRIALSHSQSWQNNTRLTVAGDLEQRNFVGAFNRPITTAGLFGTMSFDLQNQDSLSLGLSMRDSRSDSLNATARRSTAYLRYAPKAPIGPASLTFTLGAAHANYDDYAVGFIRVPGGRQDDSVFGSIGILFDDLDYAGFAPSLTLKAQKTRSNVSRFDTSEIAVSIGIRSRF